MIIVKFKGGLGNQMLQYSTYLALKERYPNIKTLADVTAYGSNNFHNGLEIERIFGIKLDFYCGNNEYSLLNKLFYKVLSKIVALPFKIRLFKRFKFIEDTNVFQNELFQLNDKTNYLIDGYWGNERYFSNVKLLLRSHFTFKKKLDLENQNYLTLINSCNSVSIHIRRGDYISLNEIFVDLCETNYYSESVNYLKLKYVNLKFFIFSDDSDWCKDNLLWLHKYDCIFIEENKGLNSYKDMELMSLCKHNIIANSTFSWWAAWLNNNIDKIVICPKHLFHNPEKNNLIISEFYPKEWILI